MYASTKQARAAGARVLGRTESQREYASVGASSISATTPKRSGDERADRRDRERRTGAPALRHGIAIDAGHHRSGLPGNAHQDRSRRAAVHRAVINAGEQHDGDDRIQAERRRQAAG